MITRETLYELYFRPTHNTWAIQDDSGRILMQFDQFEHTERKDMLALKQLRSEEAKRIKKTKMGATQSAIQDAMFAARETMWNGMFDNPRHKSEGTEVNITETSNLLEIGVCVGNLIKETREDMDLSYTPFKRILLHPSKYSFHTKISDPKNDIIAGANSVMEQAYGKMYFDLVTKWSASTDSVSLPADATNVQSDLYRMDDADYVISYSMLDIAIAVNKNSISVASNFDAWNNLGNARHESGLHLQRTRHR